MNNLEVMLNLKELEFITEGIKMCSITFFTYYTFLKIAYIDDLKIKDKIIFLISTPIIGMIAARAKYKGDAVYSALILIFFITLINEINFRRKKSIDYIILITIISVSINYAVYMISVMIAFIPNAILRIENDYIGLSIIVIIYFLLINRIFSIKKLKYGITFLQKKLESSYINSLILNICAICLFSIIMFQNYTGLRIRQVGITFIILSITMYIVIKQSFDLYYKQNLLNKDLEETKQELENKTKDVERLEKEILKSSKARHSLVHRQEVLQYQLDELMNMSSNSKEDKSKLREELESISKEVYKNPEKVELTKTGILSIDKRLEYMQSQCIKNNIEFELQVIDNIHHMKNYLIEEKDLEMLLADHIKDAIIAINSSDNENRSILVRIGKIDGVYSLYIYDSGIEFTKEVLEKLGKEPITTHRDNGGTGMGFMNTFDTLNKTKASLIINQIGPPRFDNYTKAVIFKFDNKNEFWVKSYNEEMAFKS